MTIRDTHIPTPREKQRIKELKRDASMEGRRRWQIHESARFVDQMGLDGVSRHLEVNFVQKVSELAKRFPGEVINVLFEGSGASNFPEGLTQQCNGIGVKVRVFRTDLYSRKVFEKIATEHGLNFRGYHQASPEELVEKFGESRFHLIVSRSGGVNYTPFPPVKAIHNIAKVLKIGGEAHILTEEVEKPPLPIGTPVRLNNWGKKTPVGEFFDRHPEYEAKEQEHHIFDPFHHAHPIIRIKKLR